MKLEKLTMLQIQQFYNELLKSGHVQKKKQPELKEHGLSPCMVQCVHVVLNKALEYAVEERLILANPAKKCKIPKNTRKEMLEAVGEVFPDAKYQRCTVHFYRNVFSVVPRSKVKIVAKMLKAIHAQESKKASREKAKAVVSELRAMKHLEAGMDDASIAD